ncbi:LPS export ABC transporter permease LptF [Caulobacter sp. CCUG 60055]|uniref:LPS export ABC transporter permease LptF n=1 Tax=Caulobacter sp. CCUG 60055 TaxID=2100090 RepID=UPI001FA6A9BD|nr:LPS export ABC transporter permease LptF [Caulobacter sp. CCUG 60055]MBQ1540466.1 LPS export ABC transporter permease LptF [Caulobacteraceae bacterium]MCI3178711.1 LPS export ABC transporter permease LptF [Caulobacter sp. CCUG 60055]
MRLIESYLFRQIFGPTLFATVALTAVAVLSQSLGQLDIIVDQRQSAMVFIKIILLAMPQLLAMILPIAIFVAALVALNRLHTEQEIVVCFAGGMSRWRVISPAMRLAIGATLVSLALNLWVQPWCQRVMREELFKVSTDLASTLVREGEFTEPAPGLTVYAQSIDQKGLLHNLFIHEERPQGGAKVLASRDGKIAKRNGAPVLIMQRGSNQEYSSTGVLNYLAFDEYIFELNSFLNKDQLVHYKVSDRYLHELFFPDLEQAWEKQNRKKMLAEAHSRLASPLYNIAFMSLALAAVIGGAFSRLGYGRRMAIIGAAAAVLRILGFAAQAACDDNVWLNVIQYAIPLGATWWAMAQLFRQRVNRFIAIQAIPAGRTLNTAQA